MKKYFTAFSLFFLISSPKAFALLPPLYQDIKEIQTILESPVLSKFSGEQITSIIKEKDGFRIETTRHTIFAEIIKTPSSKIGPMEFKVRFQDPVPKEIK